MSRWGEAVAFVRATRGAVAIVVLDDSAARALCSALAAASVTRARVLTLGDWLETDAEEAVFDAEAHAGALQLARAAMTDLADVVDSLAGARVVRNSPN